MEEEAVPIRTRADSELRAAVMAAIVFVRPGAELMSATPGNPVTRELASAAETAVTS